MAWLDQSVHFKTILDAGVLLVTVLLMRAVGMDLRGQHFGEVAR
jgi:hypothetical protein